MSFELVRHSQRDPKWKDKKLGDSSLTLGYFGCAVSAVAMLLSGHGYKEDPDSLNEKLKKSGGFMGAAIVWAAVIIADVTVAVTKLTRTEWIAGWMLTAAVATYLLSHQFLHRNSRWRVPKEICVAGLLTGGNTNIARVAAETGYGSEAAFSRAFKKMVGVPPSVWRHRLEQDEVPTPHPQ